MEYFVLSHTVPLVVECHAGVQTIGDALTLVAACSEHDTDRVLLLSTALPGSFFELRTQFAGEFIQKLVNYRLRIAGVFDSDEVYPPRFREYLQEARRGAQFRAFSAKGDALAWLSSS